MDTISRESNTSILPIAGIIAGVLGLVLAGVALAKLSTANRSIAELRDSLARIDSLESEVRSATAATDKANGNLANLNRTTQDAFNAVAAQLGDVRGEIAKIQETLTKPKPAAAGKAAKEPAVAGEGEYIVKSGDTPTKIAKTLGGFTSADLVAVNPGVNWNKLSIGQKLKLPKKK